MILTKDDDAQKVQTMKKLFPDSDKELSETEAAHKVYVQYLEHNVHRMGSKDQ